MRVIPANTTLAVVLRHRRHELPTWKCEAHKDRRVARVREAHLRRRRGVDPFPEKPRVCRVLHTARAPGHFQSRLLDLAVHVLPRRAVVNDGDFRGVSQPGGGDFARVATQPRAHQVEVHTILGPTKACGTQTLNNFRCSHRVQRRWRRTCASSPRPLALSFTELRRDIVAKRTLIRSTRSRSGGSLFSSSCCCLRRGYGRRSRRIFLRSEAPRERSVDRSVAICKGLLLRLESTREC